MEVELHKVMKERRAKSRKVSKSFFKIQAKKLLKEHQPDKADNFYASQCWLHRFCKCKKIKFRKRKSGKKKSGEENLDMNNKESAYYYNLSCCFLIVVTKFSFAVVSDLLH